MSKESQLKIEKNSESNDLICNSISLPFPLPIRNEEGDVIWMCKEPGWIQFVGKINRDEKCIEIDDNSSAIAIYSMVTIDCVLTIQFKRSIFRDILVTQIGFIRRKD